MVYFIQSAKGGAIKVGSSAKPESRLRDMQVGRDDELKLLGAMPGGQKTERRIHRLLAPTKIRGEWFAPSKALDVLVHCAREEIDLSPLIGLQEQELRVKLKVDPGIKRAKKKRKLNLSKEERERRSKAMKKRIREGKAGGQFGKLGGRPKNSEVANSLLLTASKNV